MSDKSRLRIAIEKFLTEFDGGLLLSSWIKSIEEIKENEFVDLVSALLDILIDATRDIPALHNVFKHTKQKSHQAGLAIASSIANSAGSMLLGGISSPIANTINQEVNLWLKKNILDPSAYIRANQLGLLTPEVFFDRMGRHGLNLSEFDLLSGISLQRLDIPQLLQVGLRFSEEQPFIDKYVNERGWDTASIDYLKMMKYQWPTPQDWIRFAVREATNEDQVKLLGLDSNYPISAQIEAEKSGLAPGMFRYYWRSHWELPSVGQGYEFLHRFRHNHDSLAFTNENLSKLLIALDIAPIWHERMMAASYSPLTRVDLRRVYKAGVIDEAKVEYTYQQDGYNDDDAKLLTQWTIWEAQASMRDLSLSRIEDAVDKGIMTENEARLFLEELRYGQDDIDTYIKLWAYDREQKRVSAEIDFLSARYMAAEIDEQVLRSELTRLGLTPNNIVVALTNLNAKKKHQVTALTGNDVLSLYENNLIIRDEGFNELLARGYNKINADRLMKLIDLKVQKLHAKELASTEKEAKDIKADTLSSQRQIRLSEINVHIAELNAETADLKVIAPDITDEETSIAIANRLLQIKSEIAYLNLEKSKVNLVYSKGIA